MCDVGGGVCACMRTQCRCVCGEDEDGGEGCGGLICGQQSVFSEMMYEVATTAVAVNVNVNVNVIRLARLGRG